MFIKTCRHGCVTSHGRVMKQAEKVFRHSWTLPNDVTQEAIQMHNGRKRCGKSVCPALFFLFLFLPYPLLQTCWPFWNDICRKKNSFQPLSASESGRILKLNWNALYASACRFPTAVIKVYKSDHSVGQSCNISKYYITTWSTPWWQKTAVSSWGIAYSWTAFQNNKQSKTKSGEVVI